MTDTYVDLATNFGDIVIKLYDADAPLTVQNFLSYAGKATVGAGYTGSFIHRLVPGFVLQGGGYVYTGGQTEVIATAAPIANEYSAAHPNVEGTVAMAKIAGDPNSATDQFFFNLADNTSALGSQNGGFTVFGRVTAASWTVVQAIAALPTQNYGPPFDQLPVTGTVPATGPTTDNLVTITAVSAGAPTLSVAGGSQAIDASGSGAVRYAVAGFFANATGTVTFADGRNTVNAVIPGGGTFTVDLSSLSGTVTSQLTIRLFGGETDLVTGNTISISAAVPDVVKGYYLSGETNQSIVGQGTINILATQGAAGTGPVLVDLKDQTVSRGGTLDATLQNIQGVQLGADPSVVLGLVSGTDLIYGGTGSLAVYNSGATDYIQGGTDTNTIVGSSGVTIFYGNGGTDVMLGGTVQSFMQAGATTGSVDTFYGNGGTDFVYGGAGATALYGGSGIEVLTGGAGANTLVGSAQSTAALNILNGGTGTDTFYAGVGTNVLYEATGTDVFAGNSGNDYVYGGAGRSFVYGGSGTTVVTTGTGNQYLKAGTGITVFNDTAANQTAGRFDQIDNFAGGKATDVYVAAAAQGSTSFVAQEGGTAILTAVAGGTATLFAAGADLATVQAHTHFTL